MISYKEYKKRYGANNDFWSTGNGYTDDSLFEKSDDSQGRVLQLHRHKQAIGNFVRILTGKDIPVKFNQKGNSYTDGEVVTISSSITANNYDSVVGLSLHEGSHVLLTDFETSNQFFNSLENYANLIYWGRDNNDSDVVNIINNLINSMVLPKDKINDLLNYINSKDDIDNFHGFVNLIEDRRIDKWVTQNAPGYVGYYIALYDRFFLSKNVDKGLKSDYWRNENFESYNARLINMVNPLVKRDDLKVLGDALDIIDLPNISRLKTTKEVINVAADLYLLIMKHLEIEKQKQEQPNQDGENPDNQNQENQNSNGNGNGNGESSEDKGTEQDTNNSGGNGEDDSDNDSQVGNDNSSTNNSQTDNSNQSDEIQEISPKDLEKALKDFNKQRDFTNGNTRKTNLSKKAAIQMEALADSDVDDYDFKDGSFKGTGSILRYPTANAVKLLIPSIYYDWRSDYNYNSIMAGFAKGNLLAKKIKVKDEKRDLVYNRQRRGKLDRRMLHQAGVGSEKLFNRVIDTTPNPINLVFTVDISGSMGGSVWDKTLITLGMFVKAAEKVDNLNVMIELRYYGNSNISKLVSILAYNSKKQKPKHFANLFKIIHPNGVTPESLNYELMFKDLDNQYEADADNIFITITDGYPNVIHGEVANTTHAQKYIKKIKNLGYETLAFFIGNESSARYTKNTYGNDTFVVNTNNVNEIGRKVNSKIR